MQGDARARERAGHNITTADDDSTRDETRRHCDSPEARQDPPPPPRHRADALSVHSPRRASPGPCQRQRQRPVSQLSGARRCVRETRGEPSRGLHGEVGDAHAPAGIGAHRTRLRVHERAMRASSGGYSRGYPKEWGRVGLMRAPIRAIGGAKHLMADGLARAAGR